MRRWQRLACMGAAGWLVLLGGGAGQPTTQPAGKAAGGSIEGVITAESEVPLSEMVIFLEPAAGSPALPAPDKTPIVVSQKGAKFEPKMVIISVGQAVNFVNDEERAIEHNVFSNSPTNKFDTGLYAPGQAKTITFDKPGPVLLCCSIHRYMDGVIYVAPTPYSSKVEESGKFSIAGVPPGPWTLKTWQRRRRFKEQSVPVTVTEGQLQTINIELKK